MPLPHRMSIARSDSMNEQTEIEQAEDQLRAAMLRSDTSSLDALIDDELVFVGADGGVYSKSDDLALHRSGEERISLLDAAELHIQAGPDMAVVSVLATMAGVFQGHAFQGRFRYLRVWRKRASGWRVVAGSVMALPAA